MCVVSGGDSTDALVLCGARVMRRTATRVVAVRQRSVAAGSSSTPTRASCWTPRCVSAAAWSRPVPPHSPRVRGSDVRASALPLRRSAMRSAIPSSSMPSTSLRRIRSRSVAASLRTSSTLRGSGTSAASLGAGFTVGFKRAGRSPSRWQRVGTRRTSGRIRS